MPADVDNENATPETTVLMSAATYSGWSTCTPYEWNRKTVYTINAANETRFAETLLSDRLKATYDNESN